MPDDLETRLQRILPELFSPNNRIVHPGQMCTPESGCGPSMPANSNGPAKWLGGEAPRRSVRTVASPADVGRVRQTDSTPMNTADRHNDRAEDAEGNDRSMPTG